MAHFDFQGKSIYYEEHGQGKPLLVLNGIMMSCKSWAEFVEPFSQNNRLILVDFLDQGRSGRMDSPFDQSIQAEVALALGCGEGKVKSSLFRSRKALRTYLEKEGIAV